MVSYLVLVLWNNYKPTLQQLKRDPLMMVLYIYETHTLFPTLYHAELPLVFQVATYSTVPPVGVVKAFDHAWDLDKANSPVYFR